MKPAIVRCMVCGHRLTAEESVKREIGPVCWKRLKRIEALNRKLEEWSEPREDQACQGFSCGQAPLGCADSRYCPKNAPEEYKAEVLSPDPVYGEMGYFDSEPLPVCPSCGKQSPNPRYCPSCGSPMKALEVLA